MNSTAIRVDGTYPNYLHIATEALLDVDEIEGKLANSPSDRNELLHLRIRRFNHYAVTIVFAGMCLESFLYDYAAHSFSDDFVGSHLDKMRFLSKCEAYPRLVTGQQIDKTGRMWAALRTLKKERDNLVHWKSASPHVDTSVEDQRKRKRTDAFNAMPTVVVNAYSALHLYAEALTKLHVEQKSDHPFPNLFLQETIDAHRKAKERTVHLKLERAGTI